MIQTLSEWIFSNKTEVAGAILGILYTFLSVRQNILAWPTGLLTSALYIFVFFKAGIYAAMSLQFYYVIIGIYGWYLWGKGASDGLSSKLQIKTVSKHFLVKLILITSAIYVMIFGILKNFTDSDIPAFDALTTSLSITATWMLARKYHENWLIWIFVNAVSIGIYSLKALWPTTLLFTVYMVMAIVGYRNWGKEKIKASAN